MKEIKRKDLVECPNCKGEAYIASNSQNWALFAIISLLATSIFMWIPIIGWVCMPITLVMFVIGLIGSLLAMIKGKATINCRNCKTKFKLNKEEYKKYKAN